LVSISRRAVSIVGAPSAGENPATPALLIRIVTSLQRAAAAATWSALVMSSSMGSMPSSRATPATRRAPA
jgi:hypothetical protein